MYVDRSRVYWHIVLKLIIAQSSSLFDCFVGDVDARFWQTRQEGVEWKMTKCRVLLHRLVFKAHLGFHRSATQNLYLPYCTIIFLQEPRTDKPNSGSGLSCSCRRGWGEGCSVGCNLQPHHETLNTGPLQRWSFSDVILKGCRISPWKEVKRECWALLQVRVVSRSLMTPAGPSVGYLLSAGLNELATSPLQTSTSH